MGRWPNLFFELNFVSVRRTFTVLSCKLIRTVTCVVIRETKACSIILARWVDAIIDHWKKKKRDFHLHLTQSELIAKDCFEIRISFENVLLLICAAAIIVATVLKKKTNTTAKQTNKQAKESTKKMKRKKKKKRKTFC